MKKLKAALVVGAATLAALSLTKVNDRQERQCKPVILSCDGPIELLGAVGYERFGNYGSFDAVVGECGRSKAYPEVGAADLVKAIAASNCRQEPCDGVECASWFDSAIIKPSAPLCVTSQEKGKCVCVRKGAKSMGAPDRAEPLDVGDLCDAKDGVGQCVPRPCVELAGYPWSAQ